MLPPADRVRVRLRIGGGTALALAALAVFVILWSSVLIGQRVLLSGDILYGLLPWSAEPAAHSAGNTIATDPIVQDLPWQEVISRDLANGILPLWNPSVGSGAPLLANDQAGVFSPFTWIALLFAPALGMSVSMLTKLLVAGVGMAFYLRTLKASSTAAVFAGIAFATSSFIVDWLAWPLSSVACFMPWAFAFIEKYLADRKPWALAGLAVIICLQFLAGHAETSLHMGLAIGLYTLVRWAYSGHRLGTLAGLTAAALTGALLAGIQLVPFFDLLRRAQLISVRSSAGVGFGHLNLAAISSWIVPNALGNPSIDGHQGRVPNFNESTGFASVAALVLSPVGVWRAWSSERSVGIALTGIGILFASMVYGPLSPVVGRVPVLAVSNNQRGLVVLCFCVAALGGLGLDGVLQARGGMHIKRLPVRLLLSLGTLGLAGVLAVDLLVWAIGDRVDALLPQYQGGYIGFWLFAGALAFATAVAFVAGGLAGENRSWAAAGLCGLALVEGALFAGTFNPREPLDQVPPPSPAVTWLVTHANGRPIAALGTTLFPESAVLYGLSDVRSYEILTDPRERTYWSAADPGYDDSHVVTFLDRPGVDWLAAAGVAYVMMPADRSLPGTTIAFSEPGVVIAEVPDPRPFAYAASSVASARGPNQAAAMLAQAPLGPVVVEGCCPAAGPAQVAVTRRGAGFVDLEVNAQSQATVVIQQSFQPGWVATIDGQPATILPANVLFQAVNIPAGHHHLALSYQPSSVTLGALSSALGAAALVLLLLVPLALVRKDGARFSTE